jgi:hypothetical protein
MAIWRAHESWNAEPRQRVLCGRRSPGPQPGRLAPNGPARPRPRSDHPQPRRPGRSRAAQRQTPAAARLPARRRRGDSAADSMQCGRPRLDPGPPGWPRHHRTPRARPSAAARRPEADTLPAGYSFRLIKPLKKSRRLPSGISSNRRPIASSARRAPVAIEIPGCAHGCGRKPHGSPEARGHGSHGCQVSTKQGSPPSNAKSQLPKASPQKRLSRPASNTTV